MTPITVYDPAMCCSTGICGPEVDQTLVDFSSDLDWLARLGADVKRFNLSQEPAQFAANETVRLVLEKSGVEGLPVIIAGDALQSSGRYPSREELAQMAGVTPEQIAAGTSAAVPESKSCGAQKAGPSSASAAGCCGGDDVQEEAGGCCS